jgi:putative ABC transport system permease protein
MTQDLRYSLRVLMKTPGFTAVAVLTLALGIGATTAIFSVVQAVLLQPLPYRDSRSLMHIWNTYTNYAGFSQLGLSPGDFYDFEKQAQSFSSMAAYVDLPQGFNLTGEGEPERLEARYATSEFFPLLGIQPIIGRAFTTEKDKPGTTPAVLISHRLWQSHFGSAGSVVGRTIMLDGRGYTLAGVLPASFQLAPAADLWLPVGQYGDDLTSHVHHEFTVVGRLKDGIAISRAQAELEILNRQEAGAFPDTHTNWKVFVGPMQNPSAEKLRPVLLVLFGAVVFVLLIACANVMNLILARNAVRQKEIALRIALGATLPRLTAELLIESTLLTGLGGALGLILAGAALRLIDILVPSNLAVVRGATLNWWVLGFTAATSLFTGILCGLIPALQILKQDSYSVLKAGTRTSTTSTARRIRDVLVVSEIALAMVLLLGAGLLLRSFYSVLSVNPGFQTDQVLSLELDQPAVPQSELTKMSREQRTELARKQSLQLAQMTEHIQGLPGVRAVGAINVLPLGSELRAASRFVVEGQPVSDAGARPVAEVRSVSLGYFAAMNIPLRKGRWFDQRDYGGDNILVNEELAHRFWPNLDPIGKRINLCSLFPKPCWSTIVGIVSNVHQYALDATPSLDVYFAGGGQTPYIVIRADLDPSSLARAAIDSIHKDDPSLPVTQVMKLTDLLSNSLSPRRLSAFLLGVFAFLALVLAAIGIYGVMNYTVSLRTKEIGIRITLGAQPRAVWRLIVLGGARLALAGIAIGVVGTLAVTKILSSMLYGVKTTDPAIITAVVLLLTCVVLIGCHIPARRATLVDPIVALHEE